MAFLSIEQRILYALKEHKKLTTKGIMGRISVGRRERERLFRELERLVQANKIQRTGALYLLPPEKQDVAQVRATISDVHERFAFAQDDTSDERFFIPGSKMLGALPGDQVLLDVQSEGRNLRVGMVGKILKEGDFVFTGVFLRQDDAWTVVPDSGIRGPVVVNPGQSHGARKDDKVVARIYKRADHHRDQRAQILAITGSSQDARACAAAILYAKGIRADFEADVLKQAERLEREGICAADLEGRVDLRDQQIFTIDGASSKDLDDAISLRKLPDGWEAGVHIADVSHYVQARSALDLQAYERGTSIYYADQVIPMLPQALSNGICSLHEGEDRLALSVWVTLDENADIRGFRFEKTVIRSRLKGIYSEVGALLSGEAMEDVKARYAGLEDTLREMDTLARILRDKRTTRGAIDLQTVEVAFRFDEQGVVRDICRHSSGSAESLIEEFMLLANQAAASFAIQKEIPFLYRVHELPSTEKMDLLFELLHRLGIETPRPSGEVRPRVLRDILESVRGGELETIVNSQILRSMAKARYSASNVGHYGLTLDRYSHFTSPIRRYPDLAIHRIIHASLQGVGKEDMTKRWGGVVQAAAVHTSAREVRAMNVERDCSRCFMAQFMAEKLGETFEGVISGVVQYGLYVVLQNGVEGMVRVENLPADAYDFDGALALTGRFSGQRYRVGDFVRVLVQRADVSSGQVDFSLAPDKAS